MCALSLCLYQWTRVSLTSCLQRSFLRFSRLQYFNSVTPRPFVPRNVYYSQNANQKLGKDRTKPGTFTKITLMEVDGALKVISFEEADKIAKRRDLKLVKLVDKEVNSQRPLYKLMTSAQYFEEELQRRKAKKEKKDTEIKGEKILSLSDKISQNDLQSKIKMVLKWLKKRYEVRVAISESDTELAEQAFKLIELSTKEFGKLVQKRNKGKEIKFSILPLINKSEETVSSNKCES